VEAHLSRTTVIHTYLQLFEALASSPSA
jgi:hypothetical protein